MPISAAPVHPPTIAVSESGASITRHGPNSSWKPSVTFHAEGHALDQRRPLAGARLLDCPLRLAVDGERVGSVHDHALEAVCLRAVGDVLGGETEVGGSGVRPLVVVADEHDRQAADA